MVRCLFLTAATSSSEVGTAAASPPSTPCGKVDSTWTHGTDTVALGDLRAGAGRNRALTVWALVKPDDAAADLRLNIRRPDGSSLATQTTRLGSEANQRPVCEPRPGLVQGIRLTGQFDRESDVTTLCNKPGLALIGLSIELPGNAACGKYFAVAETEEAATEPMTITFDISCLNRLSVEFDRLDLPELSVGSTLLRGDQGTAGKEWIIRNTGDTSFDIQALFSPTSRGSRSPSDTNLTALLRLLHEVDGKPAIRLCPGQSAVVDVLVVVDPSAASGTFSSSLSFSLSTSNETTICQ